MFFAFERPGEAQFVAQQLAQQHNISPDDPQVAATVQQYLSQIKTERKEKFQRDAIRTLLVLLAAAGVLFMFQRRRLGSVAAGVILVGLLVVDLGGVGRRYFDTERLSDARTVDDAIPQYEFDRYILEQVEAAGGSGHFRVLSLEGSPVTTARPSYFYESLGGYHGAKLRLYQDYLEHLLFDETTGLPNENALDLMNTRFVIARGPLPGARAVFRDERTGMVVNERSTLPRAFFVGEIEVEPDPRETWSRIKSPDFDPGRTAILPEDYGFRTTPIDSNSVAEVTLIEHTPHEIEWRVETDAPRLLVVSEVYYPAGWNAYLDGENIPIYRVDYLLRGVFVEAGEHHLVMRFEPKSYRIGYWLTLCSTLLVYGAVVVLLGWSYYRRRTESTADDDTRR